MNPEETRRGFVQSVAGALAAPLLAGCGRRIYDAPDLRVRNYDVEDREIQVTVTHRSETIVDDTVTLGSREQTTFDTVFEEKGSYEITGSIETDESNAETVEIENLERDHIFHLTVREEPSQWDGELISIGRIVP